MPRSALARALVIFFLGLGFLDPEQRRGLVVEDDLVFGELKSVANACQLTQAHLAAEFAGLDDQASQLLGAAALVGETDQQVALGGLNGAAGQIDG